MARIEVIPVHVHRLVGVLIIAVLGFCACTAQRTVPSDLRIAIERSVCYGTCPDYKVTVEANGNVTFEGRKFVKVTGAANAQLSQDELKDLIDAFETAAYFSLKDRYEEEGDGCPEVWTDSPHVTTSITLGGKSKTIGHYYGCQEDGGKSVYPKALTDLENRIDEIIGTKRWIK